MKIQKLKSTFFEKKKKEDAISPPPPSNQKEKKSRLGFLKGLGGEKRDDGVGNGAVVVDRKGPLKKPWKFRFGSIGVVR